MKKMIFLSNDIHSLFLHFFSLHDFNNYLNYLFNGLQYKKIIQNEQLQLFKGNQICFLH